MSSMLKHPGIKEPAPGKGLEALDDEDLITEELGDFSLESPHGSEFEADILYDEPLERVDGPVESPDGLSEPSPKAHSKWKAAYENTKYFAGGLISHPVESTKHFSILRHSHGLVFYKGPLTNVAITIFSDQPLPADRTLWLQRKGWTGNKGLKIKTLARASINWIDVTPSETLDPKRPLPPDNRAWERDIAKFLKKALQSKPLRNRKCRETDVVRIPHDAEDGYFRIVLCANGSKKVLCPSPVFRIASTSMSSGTFKGASLATVPVELGVKVASSMASTATYNLISPATQVVQNQLSQYAPGFWAQEAGTTLYGVTGAEDKVTNINEQYDTARAVAFEEMGGTSKGPMEQLSPLGDASGPEPPYPLKFSARVVQGRGADRKETGVPSANLKGIADDIKARLNGVYFGWVLLTMPSSEKESVESWKEAIITVAPSSLVAPKVAPNKEFKAYLIHDFGEATFFDVKANVLVLGYLHAFRPHDPEASSLELYRDITLTQLSLARPAWRADAVLEQMKKGRQGRSLTDHYVNARQLGQKQVDRVPLHRLGIRTDSMGLRDKWVGNGGFCIPR